MRMPSGLDARRALWVGVAFLALIALAALNYVVADVHVGALATIPILAIAALAGRRVAIPVAAVTAVALAISNHAMMLNTPGLRVGIVVDALSLALAYIVSVELVERMKTVVREKSAVENDLVAVRVKAERDPLTGLPNRAVFMNRLQFLAGHSATRFAVLFGDLDGFKEVNDVYGHDTGDRILQLAGQRIAHALRANDFVGRIGGDEFAVLLYGVHDQREVETIVHKIETSFRDPFHEGEQSISVGITLGASHFPDDSKSAETLMRIADERMYAHKPPRRGSRGEISLTLRRRRLTEARGRDQRP